VGVLLQCAVLRQRPGRGVLAFKRDLAIVLELELEPRNFSDGAMPGVHLESGAVDWAADTAAAEWQRAYVGKH